MRESPIPGCSSTTGAPEPPVSSAQTVPPATSTIVSIRVILPRRPRAGNRVSAGQPQDGR